MSPINIPYRNYDEISRISYDFLTRNEFEQKIPIDVEAILEFRLDVGIIPIPGFQKNRSIEGSLSLDMETIYVDEHVYRCVENRYRFTLAHELGHIVLHKGIFKGTDAANLAEWKKAYRSIDESAYFRLEQQAYDFAGLLLVPKSHLLTRFNKSVSESSQNLKEAKRQGFTREKAIDFFKTNTVFRLAKTFSVSVEVLERRMDKDGLISSVPW